ncbi:hypothetical protein ACQP2F_16100 [Actinoplanes sp. CA-030573]|uniref:hypothetical protein n=1 Tax=Actinoplanes sp. CA-030573 TaxID=3239898 RepID=UPI003D8F50D4
MITQFATRFVKLSPGGENFLVRDIDAALRVGMGDHHIADSLTADFCEIMYALLFALADDLQMSDAQVDELLVESRAASNRIHQNWGRGLVPELRKSRLYRRGYGRTWNTYLSDEQWKILRSKTRFKNARTATATVGKEPVTSAGRCVQFFLLGRQDTEPRPLDVSTKSIAIVACATFGLAVRTYFKRGSAVEEMASAIREIRASYWSAVDPLQIEYLIRLARGEDLILENMDEDLVYAICAVILMFIAEKWRWNRDKISRLVAQAEILTGSQERTKGSNGALQTLRVVH